MYRAYDAKTGTEALFTNKEMFEAFVKNNKKMTVKAPIIEGRCPCCHQWRRILKHRVLKNRKVSRDLMREVDKEVRYRGRFIDALQAEKQSHSWGECAEKARDKHIKKGPILGERI